MDDNTQQATQPMTQSVQADQSTTQQNADDQTAQTPASQTSQQNATTARPVEPSGKKTQQVSVSGYPEQGGVATFEADEDDDDKDDRMQAVKQEVAKKETPIPVVQMSHHEVILPPEIKEAGVEKGEDAKIDQPEEKQKIPEETIQAVGQSTKQQAGDTTLPMTYGEAQLAAKKERSIKNGITWIIRTIIREWKKRFRLES